MSDALRIPRRWALLGELITCLLIRLCAGMKKKQHADKRPGYTKLRCFDNDLLDDIDGLGRR